MLTAVKRRGRPKGSKNKSTLEKERIAVQDDVMTINNVSSSTDRLANMTDEQVIKLIGDRFKFYQKLTTRLVEGHFTSMTVSGRPGIGKTYNLTNMLDKYSNRKTNPIEYTSYTGAVTPINVYKLLYRHRDSKQLVVFDDCDRVFFEEDSINLLKAALENRTISWFSERKIQDESGEIPSSFEFKGRVIFITNLDFDSIIERGSGRIVEHLKAFMSRTMYLDLAIHHTRHVSLWVGHIVKTTKLLRVDLKLTEAQEVAALDFFMKNASRLRQVDIRTVMKIGKIIKGGDDDWQDEVAMTEFKGL